jgi:hypothetical protein
MPAQIGRDHAKHPRQGLRLEHPILPARTQTVQKYDRLAAPLVEVV